MSLEIVGHLNAQLPRHSAKISRKIRNKRIYLDLQVPGAKNIETTAG